MKKICLLLLILLIPINVYAKSFADEIKEQQRKDKQTILICTGVAVYESLCALTLLIILNKKKK